MGPRPGMDVWKILAPLGFDPWTAQPVVSCYTDYTTWPLYYVYISSCISLLININPDLNSLFSQNMAVSLKVQVKLQSQYSMININVLTISHINTVHLKCFE